MVFLTIDKAPFPFYHKGAFSCLAFSEINMARDTLIQIQSQMNFRLVLGTRIICPCHRKTGFYQTAVNDNQVTQFGVIPSQIPGDFLRESVKHLKHLNLPTSGIGGIVGAFS